MYINYRYNVPYAIKHTTLKRIYVDPLSYFITCQITKIIKLPIMKPIT